MSIEEKVKSNIKELEALVKNVSFYYEQDMRIYQGDIDGIQKILDNLKKVAENDTKWMDIK